MSGTKVLQPPKGDIAASQQAWLDRLDALIQQAQDWANELGWATRRIEKKMQDSEVGRYLAPALVLQEETDRILLEPIARSAPGVEGVVDLYLMPAYDDIATFYFLKDHWQVRYRWPGTGDAGTARDAKPKRLTKKIFHNVLAELKNHAAHA